MLVLVAEMTVKADRVQEWERTMSAAVHPVRAEPGNHHYLFHRSKDEPRAYLFYEQYDDKAALDAHMAHLKQMGIDLQSFIDGKLSLRFFELIA